MKKGYLNLLTTITIFKNIIMKKCSRCKIEKELTEFRENKTAKNGLRSECKSCEKEYREKNKEREKEYREKNKERIKEYVKEWYQQNKERVRERNKEYRKVRKPGRSRKRM